MTSGKEYSIFFVPPRKSRFSDVRWSPQHLPACSFHPSCNQCIVLCQEIYRFQLLSLFCSLSLSLSEWIVCCVMYGDGLGVLV